MSIISEIAQLQGLTLVCVTTIICVSVVSAALAISLVVYKYLGSAARQPEIAQQLYSNLLVFAGLIDGVPIVAIGLALMFTITSPFMMKVISLLPLIA